MKFGALIPGRSRAESNPGALQPAGNGLPIDKPIARFLSRRMSDHRLSLPAFDTSRLPSIPSKDSRLSVTQNHWRSSSIGAPVRQERPLRSVMPTPIRISSDPTPQRNQGPKIVKKLQRKMRTRSDDLDFGCAGDLAFSEASDDTWTAHTPIPRHTHERSSNRYSSSSSGTIPSLSHSRGHSSSSDFSNSTANTSLPPSPDPSHKEGEWLSISPGLQHAHTSRVPLVPLTRELKRRSDEIAAIDAINDYFARVRLSRVDEDPSSTGPSLSLRPQEADNSKYAVTVLNVGRSTYVPDVPARPSRSPPRMSQQLVSQPAAYGYEEDLTCDDVGDFKRRPSGSSTLSARSTVVTAVSPASPTSSVAESDVSGVLEDLSEYFGSNAVTVGRSHNTAARQSTYSSSQPQWTARSSARRSISSYQV